MAPASRSTNPDTHHRRRAADVPTARPSADAHQQLRATEPTRSNDLRHHPTARKKPKRLAAHTALPHAPDDIRAHKRPGPSPTQKNAYPGFGDNHPIRTRTRIPRKNADSPPKASRPLSPHRLYHPPPIPTHSMTARFNATRLDNTVHGPSVCVDYLRSVGEFQAWFSSDADCVDDLAGFAGRAGSCVRAAVTPGAGGSVMAGSSAPPVAAARG